MKAVPCRIGEQGYESCDLSAATHVKLNFPGPVGTLHLPVILKGTRDGTNCWTWNGDTEKPTLKPSVKTRGVRDWLGEYVSHTWVNDGQAIFLDDCTFGLKGKTVDMLEVPPDV